MVLVLLKLTLSGAQPLYALATKLTLCALISKNEIVIQKNTTMLRLAANLLSVFIALDFDVFNLKQR